MSDLGMLVEPFKAIAVLAEDDLSAVEDRTRALGVFHLSIWSLAMRI